MKITAERLRSNTPRACEEQVKLFETLYPDGVMPTVENLSDIASESLDAWWLVHLLPAEGQGSQLAYMLWCAEQVAYLCKDKRVEECLAVARRRVIDPGSVTNDQLAAARDAAWAAVYAAENVSVRSAARSAAWAAIGSVVDASVWSAIEAARSAAWAAAEAADAAVRDAADPARAAAWAAAESAERSAQLAALSQLLLECS